MNFYLTVLANVDRETMFIDLKDKNTELNF